MGKPLYPARLLTAPAVRPLAGAPARSLVAVDGLVCGWCAGRAERAFAAIAGVTAASVDLASGLAIVDHAAGAAPSREQLQRALDRAVIALRVRRALARAAGRAHTRHSATAP